MPLVHTALCRSRAHLQIVEKLVEVPIPVERIVEERVRVPQHTTREIIIEEPYPVEKHVERKVEREVERIVEKQEFVDTPVYYPKHVQVPVYHEKFVDIPVHKLQEKIVHREHSYPVQKVVVHGSFATSFPNFPNTSAHCPFSFHARMLSTRWGCPSLDHECSNQATFRHSCVLSQEIRVVKPRKYRYH